jgi:heptosyltransferase-1
MNGMNTGRLDLRHVRRVLIVKLSSIGDVVFALPVSAALGEAFPHWQLTWIVEERAAPMVQGNPYLHEVIVLPSDWYKRAWSMGTWWRWMSLRRDLRARRFDLAIDLQGMLRTALIAYHSGARLCLGYSYLREGAPFFLQRVARQRTSIHMVDQLLDVPRFLGASVRQVRFPLHFTPADDAAVTIILRDHGIDADQPFVVISPTDGGYGFKGLGVQRATALIRAIHDDPGNPVVLAGGVEDRTIGAAIMQALEPLQPAPANLIGRCNLKQLVALLRRARLHVSCDTGATHIAAALHTPTICVFGRSNPALFAPYGQSGHALHHREQCADPCRLWHARSPLNCDQACLAPPPRCLAAVSAEEIIAAVRRCWRQTCGPVEARREQARLVGLTVNPEDAR